MFDSDTPSSRTRFSRGKTLRTSSMLVRSSISRLDTGSARVRLRVTIWKSAYLIFTVTVRPAAPVRWQ